MQNEHRKNISEELRAASSMFTALWTQIGPTVKPHKILNGDCWSVAFPSPPEERSMRPAVKLLRVYAREWGEFTEPTDGPTVDQWVMTTVPASGLTFRLGLLPSGHFLATIQRKSQRAKPQMDSLRVV